MISIALDGPSGAGKSTLAKAISARFGFVYVDTGAIYRTLGLAAIRAGISSKDADGIIAMLPEVSIEIGYDENGTQSMFLGGENVSGFIRTPECSIYASDVSAIPAVRVSVRSPADPLRPPARDLCLRPAGLWNRRPGRRPR